MAIQGNFPSIRPSLVLDFANSERLDPRVTFTRASTATYYDGVTVSKAEENLFQQSQTFSDSYWAKTNITVTANSTTAPDGTSTASTLTDDATSGAHRLQSANITTTAPWVFSVFAKAGTGSWLQLRVTAGAGVWFNLSAGTVGTQDAGYTGSIVSLGSGWYRCSMSSTNTGVLPILIAMASGDAVNTYVGSGSTIFVWGAQLEQRSSISAYTATTTQAITNYVPRLLTAAANVARFDHTPTTGAALGLLVEESRVNLVTYSEDFSNAAWVKTRTTVSTNQAIAPDGTLTADNLIPSTDNNTHYTFQSLSLSAIAYTMSVYAKANGYNFVAVGIDNDDATFNLTTGEITNIRAGATASVTSVGNGWYRCSTTRTVAAGTRLPIIYATSNSTNASFAGNAYSGIFIWGAQLEAGAFATSYIPTVASTVTRSADAASMTGTNFSSWFSNAEGTFYTELAALGTANQFAAVSNPSNTTIDIQRNTSGAANFRVRVSGSDQANVSGGSYGAGVFFRAAGAYKVNDFAFSHNGSAVLTDTSGLIPVVSTFTIGDGSGRIAKIAYYPLRLTNAQLQAITG